LSQVAQKRQGKQLVILHTFITKVSEKL